MTGKQRLKSFRDIKPGTLIGLNEEASWYYGLTKEYEFNNNMIRTFEPGMLAEVIEIKEDNTFIAYFIKEQVYVCDIYIYSFYKIK